MKDSQRSPARTDRADARCDGAQLRQVIETAARWLTAHAAEVDALNVYPVPDGDTGSNMSETIGAAVREAAVEGSHTVGDYAARLAHGALMGARGNSGVILSQLIRGFAHSLDGKRTFTPRDLADALQEASSTAYRAVMKPVEGTILTVARLAAQQGLVAAQERPDFQHVLSSALAAARRALSETRNQLPALSRAGVVDAGGRGYVLLLEGALRHLQGKREAVATKAPAETAERAVATVHAHFDHTEDGFGYCTELLIAGPNLDEQAVKTRLATLGTSLLVVGDPTLLRIHVHTDDPGRVLSYAATLGRLRKVKVEDMQSQHEEFAAEVLPGDRLNGSRPAEAAAALPVGVVAVASGAGFTSIFRSLGAVVAPGGKSMNPSTEQILAAIGELTQDTVIVLPNNRNVVLTAEQAAALSGKTVHVIGTNTVPQGIAALLAVQYDEEVSQILDAMRGAASQVRTIEITTAVRDAEVDGIPVHQGDVLGLLDGNIAVAGDDLGSVLTELLDRLPATRYEIVTIYPGADAGPDETTRLQQLLHTRYPELQVEQHEGGQPHYQFVLSIE
jgi:DAK2 domain fusion protein YloV